MKKIFTIGLGAMMAVTAVHAKDATITLLPTDLMVLAVQGCMPVDLSANGKWAVGGCSPYAPLCFGWNIPDGNVKIFTDEEGVVFDDYGTALLAVSNDGIAYGYDDLSEIKIDLNTNEVTRLNLVNLAEGIRGGGIDDCSDDGNILVGYAKIPQIVSDKGSAHAIDMQAAYWEDGVGHLLPVPDEKDIPFYYLGTRARMISGDGSIIVGEIIDRLNTLPMIMWKRQADGTYELDAVCLKYWDDIRDNNGTFKGYVNFRADALSNNGKYVVMTVRDAPAAVGKPATGPMLMAYYEVETGNITKVNINGRNDISKGSVCSVYYHGVADDGTVTGGYMDALTGIESSFIMYFDEKQPIPLVKEFPDVDKLYDFEWDSKTSAITPDGKHIAGCGWLMDYQYDPTGRGYYQAFVLNVGEKPAENAVDSIIDEAGEATVAGYYSLDGRKLDAPVKGINIVRYSDGTSKKVVVNE